MVWPINEKLWSRFVCRLAGWHHVCLEGFQEHHLVSKGDLRGNARARQLCEREHPEYFLVPVCGFANRTRLTDTKEGTALLLQRQIEQFGIEPIETAWNELRDLLKPGSLTTIEAVLAHLPADDPGGLW